MKKIFYSLCLFLLLFTSCQKADTAAKTTQKQTVSTSFFPVYSITKQIAGDKINVKTVQPLDQEAHDWEPSAKDIKEVTESKALIIAGEIETWANKIQEQQKDLKIVDLSKTADKIKHGNEVDPHMWLSLENAKIYANVITDTLTEISPSDQSYFENNKKEFIEEVTNLQKEYQEKLKNKKTDTIIVPHEAFGYLAKEFGLTQYPLQGLHSIDSPSFKTMKEAVDFCKEHHIHTIFYEYGESPDDAKTIAVEIKGTTSPLSPMEFVPSADKNYLDLMRMNLENITRSVH